LNAVFTITTTTLPSGTINVPYNAFVNSSGATGTFTWNIVSGTLPAGLSLQPSTTASVVISGTPTVLGTSSFTIESTDSEDDTVKQPLKITINSPPPLSITTASLQAGTVGAPYSQTLQASGGTPPYTWSLISGVLPVGLALSSDGVIAGTPAASGTSLFEVQAVDSSSPTKQTATANLSITVNPGSTNNLKLAGNYAFSVRGFDPTGLFIAAGSFVADGSGGIKDGVMDTNDTTAPQLKQSFNGTYSISTNGLGTMTFNLSAGSRTFAIAVTAAGNASMIEFDDSTGTGTRDSGVLLKQDTSAFSTSSISGGYAFGFLGIDSNSKRYGLAGEFQANGSGNFACAVIACELDSDDGSAGPANVAITSGSYAVDPVTGSTTGRGTLTITTATGSTDYSFYIVNASELLVMEIDTFVSGGQNPLVSGTMLQQSTPGSFGNGSLNGVGVFETSALDSTSTSQAQIGFFEAGGAGTMTLSSDLNTGGTLSSASSGTTPTYTVDSTGRVTLTESGFQTSDPVLYLISQNQAFIVGTDPAVTFGIMNAQSGEPFSESSLSGTYSGGSFAPVDSAVSNIAGLAAVGSGSITFTTDISNTSGLSQVQETEDIASFASTGRVVLTENSSTAAILYLVATSQFFSLSTDTNARVDAYQQ